MTEVAIVQAVLGSIVLRMRLRSRIWQKHALETQKFLEKSETAIKDGFKITSRMNKWQSDIIR
jgi:hypothetical protein